MAKIKLTVTVDAVSIVMIPVFFNQITVELRWLEHLRNHENMFETGVIRANEVYS